MKCLKIGLIILWSAVQVRDGLPNQKPLTFLLGKRFFYDYKLQQPHHVFLIEYSTTPTMLNIDSSVGRMIG